MYKRIEAFERLELSDGASYTPLATLQDKDNPNNICHIVVEDLPERIGKCYLCFLSVGDLGFIATPYIFSELYDVLISLGSPGEKKNG